MEPILADVTEEAFTALEDGALIDACMEPILSRIRGKSPESKLQAAQWMTGGQRALLMVQILRGHAAHGVVEFYVHMSYLLVNAGFRRELIAGVLVFKDQPMAELLRQMEWGYPGLERIMAAGIVSAGSESLLESHPELEEWARRINRGLAECLPATTGRAAVYVREHPSEFIRQEK